MLTMYKNIIIGILTVALIGFFVWSNTRVAPTGDITVTQEKTEVSDTQTSKEAVAPVITTGAGGAKASASHTLVLAHTELTRVPNDVFTQTDLLTLDLSNNNLTGALPAEVRHLAQLRTLNLSYNEFTGVPAEVGQLKNLEYLDLSHNQITGLPYELGNLSNLKELILTGNNYAKADLEVIKKSLPATTKIITE